MKHRPHTTQYNHYFITGPARHTLQHLPDCIIMLMTLTDTSIMRRRQTVKIEINCNYDKTIPQ